MRKIVVAFLLGLVTSAGALAFENGSPNVILRNTYYYVVLEDEFAQFPVTDELRTLDGELLARVSHQYHRAVDIEGTGRLRDGRIINFAGRKDGEIRYFVSDARYGYGVGRCQLVPFRTVAVDPEVVALGSVVYIAETDGMKLPGGKVHDGYWRAEDIGGAIRHDRIDLFVGDGDRGDILTAVHIHNLSPLTVKVVEAPKPDSCVHQER
ncbi:MAG: hypothetical protein HY075_02400 [Deltaproteobacteria bacterium]|nr:hypothetical protein [Deltaproteobacteria bacterium]